MTDVLAIGAHPDDVELRAGGTLARFVRAGFSTAIVHLTRGEAATRGSPPLREVEAREAARRLGAERVQILDLGDGRLADDDAARHAVVRVIRECAPRVLLAPCAEDDHPDHDAASRIVRAAWYLAGIRRILPELPPHRPEALWLFPCHRMHEPSFVIALSDGDVEIKMNAIRAYRSQFHDPASTEPATRISDAHFLDGVLARMRDCGERIGASLGEPFVLQSPVPVFEPAGLLR